MNNNMSKKAVLVKAFANAFISIVWLLLSVNIANGNTITVEKEYSYQASEFDSKASSRILALEQVKKLLLEQIGTYLISETEVKNAQLSKERITLLSAGVVKTVILEEKWDGKIYFLRAKLSADTKEIAHAINNIAKEHKIVAELENKKKYADDLEKEIIRLRIELTAKTDSDKIKQYNAAINQLSSVEWFYKGLSLIKDRKNVEQNKAAVEVFNKALELYPDSSDILFKRAQISFDLLENSNYEALLKDLDKAIHIIESDKIAMMRTYGVIDCHILKSKIFKVMNRWPQAARELESAVNINFIFVITQLKTTNYRNGQQVDPKEWIEKDFNAMIQKYPRDYRGYMIRATINSDTSDYMATKLWYKHWDGAIRDYHKAISLYPNNALLHFLCGNTYINIGNAAFPKDYDPKSKSLNEKTEGPLPKEEKEFFYKKAIDQFTAAIKINPRYIEAYDNRASVYAKMQNYKNAIADYKSILAIDPEHQHRYVNLGQLYVEVKQYDNAESAFTKALSAKRYFRYPPADILKARAEVYLSKKKYKEALDDCSEAIIMKTDSRNRYIDINNGKMSIRDAELYELRAKIYTGLAWTKYLDRIDKSQEPKDVGEFNMAISDLSEAMKCDFCDKIALLKTRAGLYEYIDAYKEHLQDIDTLLSINDKDAFLYYQRASVYAKLGNLSQAIDDCTTALSLADDARVYLIYSLRWQLYFDLKRYNEAIQDLTVALKLSKYGSLEDQLHMLINRGISYHNINNYQAALADYNSAIKLSPSYSGAYYARGRVYFIMNNPNEGTNDYKIAARLGYKEAQDQLREWNIKW